MYRVRRIFSFRNQKGKICFGYLLCQRKWRSTWNLPNSNLRPGAKPADFSQLRSNPDLLPHNAKEKTKQNPSFSFELNFRVALPSCDITEEILLGREGKHYVTHETSTVHGWTSGDCNRKSKKGHLENQPWMARFRPNLNGYGLLKSVSLQEVCCDCTPQRILKFCLGVYLPGGTLTPQALMAKLCSSHYYISLKEVIFLLLPLSRGK